MYKCNQMTARTALRLFVYELRSGGLQFCKPNDDVVDLDTDVMDPRPAFLKKSGNRRSFMRRLKQLDAAFAYREHRDLHSLFFDRFDAGKIQPQYVAIEFQCFIERFDCYSKVIDLHKLPMGYLPQRT